ncbi:MAG: winged helix-turn-helix domain-containing protein [Candidatus Marinimicrobia bacterium]|nr:winged helix-turn-helix domain-containing protein [Candidatus Neomarinimicrobiota bacterium]
MNIGTLAGKVWKSLDKNGAMTASALVKALNAKSNDIYMALGWLLREDKLNVTKAGNSVKYSLK